MATAGAKVTVACKLGVAWFDLQLCEERTVMENTQTGPRDVKQYVRTGKIVRVHGTAYPRGTPPIGFPAKPQMLNGYALTPNVDKEFWDQWLSQNAKAPMVVNGLIAAYESVDALRGKTKDHVGQMSGLEPMRPDNDPRLPAPMIKGVAAVQTEDSRKGSLSRETEDA